MSKIKILVVPDLHLYDKDLENTIGYAEQSLSILKNIKEKIIEKTREGLPYDLVILGGDIQHDQLTNIKYIGKFTKELKEISEIVTEYTNASVGSRIDIQGKYHDIFYRSQTTSKLFAIRGQHDFSPSGYTFYDMLEDTNIITCPNTIIIGATQINLFDFSKNLSYIKTKRQPGIINVIGVYHNPVRFDGKFVDSQGDNKIELTPVEHQIYNGVDFAVMNDVHWHLQYQEIKTYNQKTKVVIPGSLGRTNNKEYHLRDTGNLVEITIDEVTNEIEYKYVTIELVPHEEFIISKNGVSNTPKNNTSTNTGEWTEAKVKALIESNKTALPRALKSLLDAHYDGKIALKPSDINIMASFRTWVESGKTLTVNQHNTCESIIKKSYLKELVKISNKEI